LEETLELIAPAAAAFAGVAPACARLFYHLLSLRSREAIYLISIVGGKLNVFRQIQKIKTAETLVNLFISRKDS
jgi:hypothetical protein